MSRSNSAIRENAADAARCIHDKDNCHCSMWAFLMMAVHGAPTGRPGAYGEKIIQQRRRHRPVSSSRSTLQAKDISVSQEIYTHHNVVVTFTFTQVHEDLFSLAMVHASAKIAKLAQLSAASYTTRSSRSTTPEARARSRNVTGPALWIITKEISTSCLQHDALNNGWLWGL
jgi:hypothetical protein